jgi:hypothetical protein
MILMQTDNEPLPDGALQSARRTAMFTMANNRQIQPSSSISASQNDDERPSPQHLASHVSCLF